MSDETTPKDEMDEVEGHKVYGRVAANDEPTDEGADDEVEAHKLAKPASSKPASS